MRRPRHLVEVGLVFLRIGLTSFGGPAAHIALMRDEFVRRRAWLDDATFVDLVGAANLIPGPTSSELAMHIGHRRAGTAGLIVAGLAFLLPAVVIVGVLAWWYVESGQRPAVEALLAGVAPVVVAIVAHAGLAIGQAAIRTPRSVVLLAVAVVTAIAGVPEIAVLLGVGALSVAIAAVLDRGRGDDGPGAAPTTAVPGAPRDALPQAGPRSHGGVVALPWSPGVAAAVGTAMAVAPLAVFLEFVKIGAVLFGSGYVLVALLRDELVEGLGWITETQLIDAIAVGQATPGPLFSTATFIGYLVAGPAGAVAGTVGIFLPAFIAVAVSIPVLARLRGSSLARAGLDGVNAAAVALLVLVALQLAVASLRDPLSILVAVVAGVALSRGMGTVWLIAAGAAIGLIRLAIGPV